MTDFSILLTISIIGVVSGFGMFFYGLSNDLGHCELIGLLIGGCGALGIAWACSDESLNTKRISEILFSGPLVSFISVLSIIAIIIGIVIGFSVIADEWYPASEEQAYLALVFLVVGIGALVISYTAQTYKPQKSVETKQECLCNQTSEVPENDIETKQDCLCNQTNKAAETDTETKQGCLCNQISEAPKNDAKINQGCLCKTN